MLEHSHMSPDTSTVVIRAAHRADLAAIVALLADDMLGSTRESPSDPPPAQYAAAFDAIEAQPGNEMLVATLGDEVVGCLQLTVIPCLSRRGTARGQIEAVRVSAPLRGRRIGEKLVLAAIERARSAGCGLVQLTSDLRRVDARRFYERLGFSATTIGMKLPL
jgi:ribosomal protein S18 acetylase RimI-like enzyme